MRHDYYVSNATTDSIAEKIRLRALADSLEELHLRRLADSPVTFTDEQLERIEQVCAEATSLVCDATLDRFDFVPPAGTMAVTGAAFADNLSVHGDIRVCNMAIGFTVTFDDDLALAAPVVFKGHAFPIADAEQLADFLGLFNR